MGISSIADSRTWEINVLQSEKPVFVDFWAEWCGPCRMISPVIEELEQEYGDRVSFVKVNVDNAGEIASMYNVFSIPTLALFKNGKVVSQQVGAASKQSYQSMIDKALTA